MRFSAIQFDLDFVCFVWHNLICEIHRKIEAFAMYDRIRGSKLGFSRKEG